MKHRILLLVVFCIVLGICTSCIAANANMEIDDKNTIESGGNKVFCVAKDLDLSVIANKTTDIGIVQMLIAEAQRIYAEYDVVEFRTGIKVSTVKYDENSTGKTTAEEHYHEYCRSLSALNAIICGIVSEAYLDNVVTYELSEIYHAGIYYSQLREYWF